MSEIGNTLGGRILLAREACDLTISQLAKRLGVKTSTARNWESNQSEPRANRLSLLAGVLGVSPAWLLVGYGDGPVDGVTSSEIMLAQKSLEQARQLHQKTGDLLLAVQRQLERLTMAVIDSDQLTENKPLGDFILSE